MNPYHTPVLLNEVIENLRVEPGKRYIDATLGGAGHTIELLRHGGRVLGIDADDDAIAYAREEIGRQLPQLKESRDWILAQGNFRNIEAIAKDKGFEPVDGILFDLGVSSRQLDSATKGFTYRVGSGRLDMRFDQKVGETAADILASSSEDDLYEIFTKFGEEERARSIAHALVRARSINQLETVGDVGSVITRIVPGEKERFGVLSRLFQALRIAVNDELTALREGLGGADRVLGHKGSLVVISFHSLEDRIVKQFLQKGDYTLVTKKPLIATEEERYNNVRARSAKLRVAQKI